MSEALVVLYASLTSYIVTAVIAGSHIFKTPRKLFRGIMGHAMPWIIGKQFVQYIEAKPLPYVITDDPDDVDRSKGEEICGFDMVSCRLCMGFWISCLVACFVLPWYLWGAVYGLSYFLTSQER